MAQSGDPGKALVEELVRVLTASHSAGMARACLLATRDRDYALALVKQACVAVDEQLYHFSVGGRRRYDPATRSWLSCGGESLSEAGELLHQVGSLRRGVVILEDCASQLDDERGNQRVRTSLAHLLSTENASEGLVLVFLEPPEAARHLPSILAEQFVRLEVPYPRTEELQQIAREEIAITSQRRGTAQQVEGIQRQAVRLASGMVGLTRSAARDALRDALAPDAGDFEGAFQRLQHRKRVQLSRELAMNVLYDANEACPDAEGPIGLDYLVEYLEVTRNRIHLMGRGRAKGILLIGPPGTGKTMLARCIGRLVGLPVVEFRISSLMSSLLGDTERRFAQAFATLEAMAPNVVFIDEIEKAFGDSTERDGGTMMRCTGSLLSWLSDNPYPNFIVATSNSLRRMGEIGLTMTRSERFDACFFVDVPSLASRWRMLEHWLAGSLPDARNALRILAEKSEKFSGADLHSAVKLARTRAEHADTALSLGLLEAELERKRRRALALYEEFQELRHWGHLFCDPAGPTDEEEESLLGLRATSIPAAVLREGNGRGTSTK